MIVVDAAAMLELLLITPVGARIGEKVFDQKAALHAPHLLDVEVTQVLRRFCRTGECTPQRAVQALQDLGDLGVTYYPHKVFLPRMWELRDNLTAYDASYVALAEALDVPLFTLDGRIARAPGHGATVEVF